MKPLTFFSFVQDYLAIWGPLNFHMNLRIGLPISANKLAEKFKMDLTESLDKIWEY